MTSQQALQQQKEQTTTWTLDPVHSRAEFAVRHMMISTVRGAIPIKSATIERHADITQSKVRAELDIAALTTNANDRDAHLRSADFFDVANHPTIVFESERVEEVEDGLRVHGQLTIRGISRPVVLDVELHGETKDPWGGRRAGATATTTIDRRDWGLTWNAALETGGVLVGDKVKVRLDLQGVQQ